MTLNVCQYDVEKIFVYKFDKQLTLLGVVPNQLLQQLNLKKLTKCFRLFFLFICVFKLL